MLKPYVDLLFVWPIPFLSKGACSFLFQESLFPWLYCVNLVGCLFSGAYSLEQACLYMPVYFDLLVLSCVSLLIYSILIFDKKKKKKRKERALSSR